MRASGQMRRTSLGVLLALATVSGCGREDASTGSGVLAQTTPEQAEPSYSCTSPAYPRSVWTAQEPVARVEHPGRSALVETLAPEGLDGWFLLEAGAERLAVARERDEPMRGAGERAPTHDLVIVEDFGPRNGWHESARGSCTPRLALEDVGVATVWLDGRPNPRATRVELLVVEHGCASGVSAEGRTTVVHLSERRDAVALVIGIEPLAEGPQTCPGNPATPMVVELTAPLGDRPLVDASLLAPQPVRVAPDDLWRGWGK